MTSLDKRVDSCQRGIRFIKRFRSSALRLFLVGVFCSEDMIKLLSNPRFSKSGKSQLSTFPRIICGHRWTTQPFIAFDRLGVELVPGSWVWVRDFREAALCENYVTPLLVFAATPTTRESRRRASCDSDVSVIPLC